MSNGTVSKSPFSYFIIVPFFIGFLCSAQGINVIVFLAKLSSHIRNILLPLISNISNVS